MTRDCCARGARESRASGSAGFTLIETLISSAIFVVIISAVLAIVVPAQGAGLTVPEAADVQQRLRVAGEAIAADLTMAGAGPYQRATDRPLGAIAAAVLPRRSGGLHPDGEDVIADDRISIAYVPPTAAQGVLEQTLSSAAGPITVGIVPGCPLAAAACGFTAGMSFAVFDESGASDAFAITDALGPTLQVRHQGAALTRAYPAGSRVAEIVTVTYWLDRTGARLMRYDGDRTDLPLVDNIVSLRFEWFGDSRAPRLTNTDPALPSPTYGPRPPPPGVDAPGDTWAAGENCTFFIDAATGAQTPRLPDLAEPAGGAAVALDAAGLQDGPWCPDPAAPNRYDADLLRVRMLRVTIRAEAARDALRGPAGPLFLRGGTGRGAARLVPDREIQFDVAPRNLNLVR